MLLKKFEVFGFKSFADKTELEFSPGINAIVGPNGSGKSTLAYTLMGHPNYKVTQGEAFFKGQNVLEMEADERSRLGLFLAFQYPVAIPGVTVANFLRTALNSRIKAEAAAANGGMLPSTT